MGKITGKELRGMIEKCLEEEITEEEKVEMKVPATKDEIRKLFCSRGPSWKNVSDILFFYLDDHYEEIDDLPLEVITYFKTRNRRKARNNPTNRDEIVCDLVKRYFELNPDNLCSFSYLMCNLGRAVTTSELEYALLVLLKDYVTPITIHGQNFWYVPELLNIKRAKLCTPSMEEEGI